MQVAIKDYAHNKDNEPVVSVVNWVFNQKDYIEANLNSILNQVVSFPVEIIVQDDASTDGTLEILDAYIAQHPDLFNCILHKYNKYSCGDDITVPPIAKARGKYIALICGDDYWTDPLKLQKQVDFLENNSGYNVVGGRSKVYLQNRNSFRKTKEIEYQDGTLSVIEYLYKRPFHTSSIMFRNQFVLPKWFEGVYPGDKFLVAVAADRKALKVLDDQFSVYRINDGGITSNLTKQRATELLINTNIGLSKLYNYLPERDIHLLYKLIQHNEVLIQFGLATNFNKFAVFVKNFNFLVKNRKWINLKVFLARLK